MKLRRYREGDGPGVARVYREATLITGRVAYSEEQVRTWSTFPDDFASFTSRLSQGITLVASMDEQVVGFGQLDP